MAKLTKEQKFLILSELEHPYAQVKLRCDNDIITLSVEPTLRPLEFKIMTYVNGKFNASWLTHAQQHPEAKYLYTYQKCFLTAKDKKCWQKILGKKELEQKIAQATYTLYSAYFPTAKMAISHLCKVCEQIDMIKDQDLA